MFYFLPRLVILLSVLVSCNPDIPAIEKRLKEDKSRPGKVGTLRALEVVHFASRMTNRPCKPAIDLDFEGEFKSELAIHLRRRNGETFRRLHETRILSATEKISRITTEKRTIDELGIEHHAKRAWIFDGERTSLTTTLGHGEITGPRRPRSDEKEKIFDAALSSFRAFRAFSDPNCVTAENESIEKILKEITLDKNDISDNKATLNWRAMSQGRRIEVKYNHELLVKKMDIKMPENMGKLEIQTSGFESARAIITELKKEQYIK